MGVSKEETVAVYFLRKCEFMRIVPVLDIELYGEINGKLMRVWIEPTSGLLFVFLRKLLPW